MASNDSQITTPKITEGLFTANLWNPLDFHFASYLKSPIQLYFISTKTSVIGRALRHAIVDLLDNIAENSNEHVENDTTIIGTEHRLYHSRQYTFKLNDDELQCPVLDTNDRIQFEITSLAPTVFYHLRENLGISNTKFRQSFFEHHLKDFTNPGKSGSLMYKTFDDLFILKTLREYEARLLMQILSDYHLQLTQRSTILNRYIGLYLIRFPTSISTIEIYVVIMVNVFTPSLQINEIFDLKGSTIKRKLTENLSRDKLHKLKDLDFIGLYPHGIRIPSNIYHRLHNVISNDVKVLRKLNIIDYSLILGIRHLDISEDELTQYRPSTGIAALFYMSHTLALSQITKHNLHVSDSQNDLTSLSIPYLKPIKMLNENIDTNLFYHNDLVASSALPIPGIINKTNQRVYLYLAIIDMLQTYDSFKYMEQTFKKLTDPYRHLQYSVIEPGEYEKRITKFLFDKIFVDAEDDFPWATTDNSKPIVDIANESTQNNTTMKRKPLTRTLAIPTERGNSSSNNFIHFHL
jgi:hypothetical protein